MSGVAAIEFRRVSKRFPGILANDRIALSVMPGEIHAIVGENGAGKSTLMMMLAGLNMPDEGEIAILGKLVKLSSPQVAIESGIGMVHQHFMLVECFTVLQNIILGCEKASILLPRQRAQEEISRICRQYGLSVDLDAEVAGLSVGVRQQVEILKLLFRGGDILILDEPTAVLTPSETVELLAMLKKLKNQGKTILYISHKLNEVLAIADKITVLRQGRVMGTVDAKNASMVQLVDMMIGRNLEPIKAKRKNEPGPVALTLSDVWCKDGHGRPLLRGVTLEVQSGEIYGVAGVAGNGQQELSEVISGLKPINQGDIFVCGTRVTGLSSESIRQRGVGMIPEDRERQGLISKMSVWENFLLGQLRKSLFSRPWRIFQQRCQAFSREKVLEYDIRLHSVLQSAGSLSGGNKQKIILARELSLQPKVLIASQPARGLDVGAEETVHANLLSVRDEGTAVLLISSDLEEILALSDRVGILFNGRIIREFSPGELTLSEIGHYMSGDMQGEQTA